MGLTARGVGAQRLAASEVWAVPSSEKENVDQAVLNALRHQRFGQVGAVTKVAKAG